MSFRNERDAAMAQVESLRAENARLREERKMETEKVPMRFGTPRAGDDEIALLAWPWFVVGGVTIGFWLFTGYEMIVQSDFARRVWGLLIVLTLVWCAIFVRRVPR